MHPRYVLSCFGHFRRINMKWIFRVTRLEKTRIPTRRTGNFRLECTPDVFDGPYTPRYCKYIKKEKKTTERKRRVFFPREGNWFVHVREYLIRRTEIADTDFAFGLKNARDACKLSDENAKAVTRSRRAVDFRRNPPFTRKTVPFFRLRGLCVGASGRRHEQSTWTFR